MHGCVAPAPAGHPTGGHRRCERAPGHGTRALGPASYLAPSLFPYTRPSAGAQLREWYLGGTASGQMQATASLRLSNVTAEAIPGGMAAAFVQELPEGRDPAELELIFAAGAVFGNGGMR